MTTSRRSTAIVLGLMLLLQPLLALAAPFDNEVSESESAAAVCPRIVTRAEWKARKPRSTAALAHSPAPYYVVHHGGIERYCHDQASCSAVVRSYQNMHLDENHWEDIGYQFLVGEDGNVYEGRGWERMGAHAPGYNTQSIGICVIGDFQHFLPNEAALKALRALLSCGVALGKVREDYLLIGHRQARSTECPGESLFRYVQQLPHWTEHPTPIPAGNQTAAVSTPAPTVVIVQKTQP